MMCLQLQPELVRVKHGHTNSHVETSLVTSRKLIGRPLLRTSKAPKLLCTSTNVAVYCFDSSSWCSNFWVIKLLNCWRQFRTFSSSTSLSLLGSLSFMTRRSLLSRLFCSVSYCIKVCTSSLCGLFWLRNVSTEEFALSEIEFPV